MHEQRALRWANNRTRANAEKRVVEGGVGGYFDVHAARDTRTVETNNPPPLHHPPKSLLPGLEETQ